MLSLRRLGASFTMTPPTSSRWNASRTRRRSRVKTPAWSPYCPEFTPRSPASQSATGHRLVDPLGDAGGRAVVDDRAAHGALVRRISGRNLLRPGQQLVQEGGVRRRLHEDPLDLDAHLPGVAEAGRHAPLRGPVPVSYTHLTLPTSD